MNTTLLKHFDFEIPGWGEFSSPPALRIPYEAEALADDPVVYFRLAEASGGEARDASGHGHHGSYEGTLLYEQAGVVMRHGDGAVKLPGDGGHVSLVSGVVPVGSSARTIEAWFKVDGSPAGDSFFNCGAAGSGTQVSIDVQATSIAIETGGHRRGVTGLSLIGWHHLALIFPDDGENSDDWLLYLNAEGVSLTTLSGSTQTVQTGDSMVYLGRHLTTSSSWSGWIDEVAIYDTALPRRRLASHVHLAQPA